MVTKAKKNKAPAKRKKPVAASMVRGDADDFAFVCATQKELPDGTVRFAITSLGSGPLRKLVDAMRDVIEKGLRSDPLFKFGESKE